MKRFFVLIAVLVVVAAGVAVSTGFVTAQQDNEGERSAFITYVENKISTPSMQIRLNGLRGALSSNVQLDSITISDTQGVWLTIEKPELVWTRSALLRGRVEVDSLTAEKVEWTRMPEKDDSAPSPEASTFSVPSLPVAINLNKLDIKSVNFGQEVFGLESKASVAGKMTLDGGALDTNLEIDRLDGPGGALKLVASYANDTRNLNLDLSLTEPENGIVANLLNIPGRPPVALSLKGNAPVDNLDVALQFDAGGQRVLDGQLQLRRQDGGLALDADLRGPLGTILAAEYRPLFGTDTLFKANAMLPDAGGIRIDNLDVESGAIRISAKAETLADGVLSKLDLGAGIHPPQGSRVLLPFGAEGTNVGTADVTVKFDAAANERWTASLAIDDLSGKDVSVASINLDTAGTVTGIADAARRAVSFNTNGKIDGIVLADPELTMVLRDGILLNAKGNWRSGNPVTVDTLTVSGSGLDFVFAGEIAGTTSNGHYELAAKDLSALSALAGKDLAGAVKLAADGKVEFVTQAFDLAIDGSAQNLKIGDKRVDGLIGGKADLAGHVSRSPDGLAFENFALQSAAATIRINGRLASREANLEASAHIRDIAVIDKRAAGAADLTASVQGTDGKFSIRSNASIKSGRLLEKPLSNASIIFDGRQADGAVSGKLTGKGNYAGDVVSLAADIASANGTISIGGLNARFGPTVIKGSLSTNDDGLITSDLTVSSKNIRSAAAFALLEASGAVDARIVLEPKPDGTQSAQVTAKIRKLKVDGNSVGSGDITADAKDLFGALLIDLQFDGKDITAGGVDIAEASATAQTMGERTTFNARARLTNDSRLSASGAAVRKGDLTDLTVQEMELTSAIADARLTKAARISIENGTVQVSAFDLAVGNGRISAEGVAGKTLDFKVVFKNLPLEAANAVKPDLGLAGSLSGSAHITGEPSDPTAVFEVDGNGISANQLAEYDVSVIDVQARGSFKSGTVRIERATASNGQGISITANGAIPLSGPGLDFDANGSGPLGLAEPLLRTRGTSLKGTVTFNAHLAGSLSEPNATGQISIAGASIEDPLSNLRVENVALGASLRGDAISIDSFSASVGKGGSVSVSGTIGLGRGMPADISIRLDNASYSDGRTVSAKASGDLKLTGPLLRDPLLSGTVTLIEVEITIPETIASSSKLLEVKHINTPERVQRTLDRVASANPVPRPEARPSVLQFDITVTAPNRLFVRGRGMDAELGGSVRLTGPATNIQPVGAFRLIRGRINIVGRRIVFNEGTVRLVGNLDPFIDFTATTTADDIDATIRLTGRASNPKVTFTSQPELPQDEVLAYIIFGKSITNLSPGQIARLASIAAELAGGGGGSLLNNLRSSTGLDELDVVSDGNGSAAVKAGRYVSDKVYLGVQAGSKETEATINLDITNNLTARGAANSKGDSSLGLFFEKDY